MADDIIRLKNMVFHAHHGVWDEEREVGQRFRVDVELYSDIRRSAESDLLKDTIDLYKVYEVVRKAVVDAQYKLIETLAERIAADLLAGFPVPKLMVRVHKPNSPIRGLTDGIEVEIVRTKTS